MLRYVQLYETGTGPIYVNAYQVVAVKPEIQENTRLELANGKVIVVRGSADVIATALNGEAPASV